MERQYEADREKLQKMRLLMVRGRRRCRYCLRCRHYSFFLMSLVLFLLLVALSFSLSSSPPVTYEAPLVSLITTDMIGQT